MKNKIISLLLVLCFCAAFLPAVSVSAEESDAFTFYGETSVSDDGAVVVLNIYIRNNPGFTNGVLQVSYNADVFSVKSAKFGSGVSGNGMATTSSQTANPYKLIVAYSGNIYGDILFATITFNVRSNVGAFAETFVLTEAEDDPFMRNLGTKEDEDFSQKTESANATTENVFCTNVSGFASSNAADFTYTTDKNGATVTGYKGSDTAVVIPSTLGGKPVVAIAGNAFANNATAVSVTIPSTVDHVASGAFTGCTAVEEYTVLNPNCVLASGSLGTKAVKYRGYANAKAYADGIGATYVAISSVVSADVYQVAIDDSGFRVVGSVSVLENLSFVGFEVTRASTGATASGQSNLVYNSISNFKGQTLTAESEFISYDYLTACIVNVAFKNGEIFYVTPYVVGTDGTVYYGETAPLRLRENGMHVEGEEVGDGGISIEGENTSEGFGDLVFFQ